MIAGNGKRILEILKDGSRMSKRVIGRKLAMSTPAVGQNLRTLKKRGFVQLADDAWRGRCSQWKLTEAGESEASR